MENISRFDAADYLNSLEDISTYLTVVLEEEDLQGFFQALGTVARSKGMSDLAKKTGLNRESLYSALSTGGNPLFSTVCKVLKACSIKLVAVPSTSTTEAKTVALG